MGGEGWLGPDTCGVKLAQFEQMTKELSQSAPRLEQLSHQLWQALNAAGVSTAPAMEIKRIARWAQDAATDLRRRNQLVQDMERQKLAFPICTADGTYFKLPDRYKDQLAYANGKRAVDLLRRAKDGDREALHQLNNLALTSDSRNPHFTKAFLEKLGAVDMVEIPIMLAQRLRRDIGDGYDDLQNSARDTRGALSLLSKSLAVGTDPTSPAYMGDAYLGQLRDAGRRMFPPSSQPPYGVSGYQGLSSVLAASSSHRERFSARFMEVVGRDMIAFDRETHKRLPYVVLPDLTGLNDLGNALDGTDDVSPGERKTDMLAPLLTAAGESKEASQALLDYTTPGEKNSHLAYLLHDRRNLWAKSDHGAALGQAMKAAMSGHDESSQKLFKEMSELLGREIRRFYSYDKDGKLKFDNVDGQADDLSGMRYDLGQIMRAHLADIDNSLFGDVLSLKGTLASRDVDALLAEVAQDDKAFAALMMDQIGRTRVLLDQQYANGKGIKNILISQGTVLGHLLAMRRETLIARGVKVDEANQQMKNFIDQGIGLVPVPYVDLFGEVSKGVYEQIVNDQYGKVGDWLAQQIEHGGGSAQQDSKTVRDEQVVTTLLRQMSLSVSVEHANDAGTKVVGESFADDNGKIRSISQWANDPEVVNDFIKWCKKNDFTAPSTSEGLRAAINNSHNDAVNSFNNAEPGELTQ